MPLHTMRRLTLSCLLAVCTASAYAATPAELNGIFHKEVTRKLTLPEGATKHYLDTALEQLHAKGADLSRDQMLVTVDRNPNVQALVLFAGNDKDGWHFVGASPVSTGTKGRFDHYVTPTGVYDHTLTDYSDFRAEGTKNEYGIRGYGKRGMRVWDFGWVPADKGWLKNRKESGDIRFQMHATDPDRLESRLGTTASKGCVRMSTTLNAFLDKYGALDWHYEQAATQGKTPWVLKKDRVSTGHAGRYLVVLDSEVDARPSWAAR